MEGEPSTISSGIPEGTAEDTELLDLLQASHDAALLQQMDEDVAAAAATAATAARTRESPKPLTSRTAFLVGGTLFGSLPASRSVAFLRHQTYSSRRTPVRLFDTRGRHAAMSALHAGALYCAFTHQFISLASPHWHHLQAVGFGLDVSIQGGRRMTLVRAGSLYRCACALQGSVPNFTNHAAVSTPIFALSTASGSSPPLGERRPETPATTRALRRRADACYAAWHWSPLLAGSLGAMLERAPVDSFLAFYKSTAPAVKQAIAMSSARRMELAFVPLDETTGFPVRDKRWVLPASQPAVGGTGGACSGCEGVGSDVAHIPQPRCRGSGWFGSAFVQDAVRWRQTVLQGFPKTAERQGWSRFSEATGNGQPHPVLMIRGGRAVESASVSSRDSRLVALTAAEAPVPMLTLPPQTRVAALVLTSTQRTASEWASEMERAVSALVRELWRTLPPDAALYVCPVHHSVDYNSVLDLAAFRVARCVEHHEDGESNPPLVLGEPLPMLSLGLEGVCEKHSRSTAGDGTGSLPRKRVVVVSDAQLLSRRAIGRLLDQWTRNGAARQSRERHQRHVDGRADASVHTTQGSREIKQEGDGDGGATRPAPLRGRDVAVRWRLLLRADPFTTPTRVRYLNPFGSVQALFLSHDFAGRAGAATDKPSAPLFHLQEPLSAALLRYGAAVQRAGEGQEGDSRRSATAETSNALLHAVCAAAVRDLPDSLVLRQAHTKLSPTTGRRFFQETTVPSRSPRGQRIFYQACEELVMSQQRQQQPQSQAEHGSGAPADASSFFTSNRDVEALLSSYPFLSHIQCQHRLVERYTLELSGSTHEPLRQVAATVVSNERAAPPTDGHPAPKILNLNIVPMQSAAEMLSHAVEARAWLLRMARATVFPRAHRHQHPDANAGDRQAHIRKDARRRRPVLEQQYQSHVEPSVLLGFWTPTLLMCAPAVADVLPLRHELLERLQLASRQHEGDGQSDEGSWRVVDVDMFHVDYVVFPLDRRCRLFGVRALLQPPNAQKHTANEASTLEVHPCHTCGGSLAAAAPPTCDSAEALHATHDRLHSLLREAAAAAAYFPLWTYHVLPHSSTGAAATGSGVNPGDVPLRRGTPCMTSTLLVLPRPAATKCTSWHFDFSSVEETNIPCTPNLVERRLFAMEAVQHPPLHLCVGSHVVLTAPVVLRTTPLHTVLRGTLCRVDGFVDGETVQQALSSATSASGALGFHTPSTSEGDVEVLQRYLAQQREATALPLLCPLEGEPPSHTRITAADAIPFLLLPQTSLVGGYRSLHYYALPVAHLPIRPLTRHMDQSSLTPPRHFFRNAHRGAGGAAAAVSGSLSVCFPVQQLFHPYHAHTDALAFLALSLEQRRAAFDLLVTRREGAEDGATDLSDPFTLVEDVILSATPTTAQGARKRADEGEAVRAAKATEEPCEPPTELPLLPATHVPDEQEQSMNSELVLSCDLLTTLSLFVDSDDS